MKTKCTFWTDLKLPKTSLWHRCPLVRLSDMAATVLPETAMAGILCDPETVRSVHGRGTREEYERARGELSAAMEALRVASPGRKAFCVGQPAIETNERPSDIQQAMRFHLMNADVICVDCSYHGERKPHDHVERCDRNRRTADEAKTRRPIAGYVSLCDPEGLPWHDAHLETIVSGIAAVRPRYVVLGTFLDAMIETACVEASSGTPLRTRADEARRTLARVHGCAPERWTRRQAKLALMGAMSPRMDALRAAVLGRIS